MKKLLKFKNIMDLLEALQKKIKVNTKDNFKDTLDAMLKVDIKEVSNKKRV